MVLAVGRKCPMRSGCSASCWMLIERRRLSRKIRAWEASCMGVLSISWRLWSDVMGFMSCPNSSLPTTRGLDIVRFEALSLLPIQPLGCVRVHLLGLPVAPTRKDLPRRARRLWLDRPLFPSLLGSEDLCVRWCLCSFPNRRHMPKSSPKVGRERSSGCH